MDIKVYANEIANRIDDAEVKEVTKTNGVVRYGIIIKNPGSNVAPTIYVEEMYEDGLSVDEAVKEVTKIYNESILPNVEIDIVTHYEQIKDKLIAKLINEKKNDYIGVNAGKYGYDDLKIVPYINMNDMVPNGSIRVTENLLETWNVDIKDVVNQALENIKDDVEIVPMIELLAKESGMPSEMLREAGMDNGLYVATNKKKVYGAIAGLFIKDKMIEKLPYGYTVIPSSVHELIIIPNEMSGPHIDAMINDVNNSCLTAEDFLSDHRYEFV